MFQPNIDRLNKYLAFHLGISRREADDYIASGKVSVNNEVAILGKRLVSEDSVTLNGKPVSTRSKFSYIMLNKPLGYVCSRKQQGDSETIYALLPQAMHHLKPVGRLDKDSSGLLLLTDDGDFAFEMTHPKFQKTKSYEIMIDKELEPLHQQMITDHGIMLEDGNSKLSLERMTDEGRLRWRVLMHEGRNRQIRRTFAAIGYDVIELHRTSFGSYSLVDLKTGELMLLDK